MSHPPNELKASVDRRFEAQRGRALTERTAWVRSLATPIREFISTENASAVVLLAATLGAMLWANSPWGTTYEQFWSTELSFRLAGAELALDLRQWVNDGLMAFFFFVAGLEIRREVDMGELRERRRVATPVLAAVGGLVAPALIYLAFNAGEPTARGWGIPIGTDTAFALGVLALVGRRCPARIRVFLLTLVIVDDVGALTVVALAYTGHVSPIALLLAVVLFGVVLALRRAGVRHGVPYFIVGLGVWLSMLASGVHPTIAGVALGLLATAHPPAREDLQRAGALWRLFRPWTSFVIVPLFALANAGVEISGEALSGAASSPIALGIVFGLVGGKAIGIVGATWLATRRFPRTLPWPPPSIPGSTTSVGPTTRRSRLSSTVTSSVPTVGRPSRSSGSSWRSSAPNCASCSATSRSPTCTSTPSSGRRQRRRPTPRVASGRCTTLCSPTRTPSTPTTCPATPPSWGWTSSASRRSCARASTRPGSLVTSRAPIRAGSSARQPSLSTGAATTAPTTSTPWRAGWSERPERPSPGGDPRDYNWRTSVSRNAARRPTPGAGAGAPRSAPLPPSGSSKPLPGSAPGARPMQGASWLLLPRPGPEPSGGGRPS